jgi:hypothetical protein
MKKTITALMILVSYTACGQHKINQVLKNQLDSVMVRRRTAGFPSSVEQNAKRLGVVYRVIKLSDIE